MNFKNFPGKIFQLRLGHVVSCLKKLLTRSVQPFLHLMDSKKQTNLETERRAKYIKLSKAEKIKHKKITKNTTLSILYDKILNFLISKFLNGSTGILLNGDAVL